MPDHNQEINTGESVDFVLIIAHESTRVARIYSTCENGSADTCG